MFSSHSFWTSSSLDVPAGVTQKEGHTGFLIHLLSSVRALFFLARRIQPFLSFVDREVEFCVLTILIVLHPLGIFSFLVRKIPFAGIELTSQRVRRLHGGECYILTICRYPYILTICRRTFLLKTVATSIYYSSCSVRLQLGA